MEDALQLLLFGFYLVLGCLTFAALVGALVLAFAVILQALDEEPD